MLRKSFWLLAGWLCLPTQAAEFSADIRYQALRSRSHELVETLGMEWQAPRTALRFATRLNHSGFVFNECDYLFEGRLEPLSWVVFGARLLHRNRLQQPSSTTNLLASLTLQGHFPRFLSYFFTFGGYLRLHQVGSNSLLPFTQASFSEGYVATALGLGIHPTPQWAVITQLSTIDSVDIYNLNHPYIEVATHYTSNQEWTAQVYARYQFLLGFGLADAWVGGVRYTRSLLD